VGTGKGGKVTMPFQSSHGFLVTAHKDMDSQFSLEDIEKMSLEMLLHWQRWESDVGGLSDNKKARLEQRIKQQGIDPHDYKTVERISDSLNKKSLDRRMARDKKDKIERRSKTKRVLGELIGKTIAKIVHSDSGEGTTIILDDNTKLEFSAIEDYMMKVNGEDI
jgi:hypothetical protein